MIFTFPLDQDALVLFVKCEARWIESAWHVTDIALYSHPSCALSTLVMDGLRFDTLPVSSQEQLTAAMDDQYHTWLTRRTFGRLYDDVMGALGGAK